MFTKSDKKYLEEHFVTIETFNETMKEVATKKELRELDNKFDKMMTISFRYIWECAVTSRRPHGSSLSPE